MTQTQTGLMLKKFGYENAIKIIKYEKGDPLDFLTAPILPSKEFGQAPRTQTAVHL